MKIGISDSANPALVNGSEEALTPLHSSNVKRSRRAAAKGRAKKSRKRLAIALIESRSLIRDALAHQFEAARRDCRILVYPSASDLLRSCPIYKKVDLILVSGPSANTSSDETLDVIRQLTAASDRKRIIIFSDRDDAAFMASAIRQGARGFIPTNFDLPVAMAAVEVVLAGGIFAPASVLIHEPASEDKLRPQPPPRTSDFAEEGSQDPRSGGAEASSQVTVRESDVLACLTQGKSNKLIARDLQMREGTVKVHLRHLMRKLNAANRTQLALHARPALGSEQIARRPR